MSDHTMPPYGRARITLQGKSRKHGGKRPLVREVWAEGGPTSFFDDKTMDFQTWPGEWKVIETLGLFDGTEDAGEFLRTLDAGAGSETER